VDEVRRFNPALTTRVPDNATLYLPELVSEFGTDVSFWHRAPTAAYTAALDAFLQLDAGIERWHQPSFEAELQEHRRRFEATDTEEGTVMAAVLGYVISDLRTSRRAAILADFRSNGHIHELFRQGAAELALLLTRAAN
jgi:hypothetical protein